MSSYVCFFVFCLLGGHPSPKCESVMSKPTVGLTDKMVDTIVKKGTAFSVCGTPEYVKGHEIYLRVKK